MKKPRKKGGREKEGAEVAAHLNVLHVLAMLAKLHVAGAGMLHFEDAGDGDGGVKYRNNGFASARKMVNEKFLTTCQPVGRKEDATGKGLAHGPQGKTCPRTGPVGRP